MSVANKISNLIVIGVIILALSCERKFEGSSEPDMAIYKLRGNYINNVCVAITDDKTRIYGYPSPNDNAADTSISPFKMNDGYYLDGCCNYGVNSAYLSITKSEYKDMYPLSKDSLFSLILDADPYVEYYVDENHLLSISKPPEEEPYFAIDTALLNEIITNNELDKYFTKLK